MIMILLQKIKITQQTTLPFLEEEYIKQANLFTYTHKHVQLLRQKF